MSVGIVVISLVLILYWFRHACLVILRDRGEGDYAERVAIANHLTFQQTGILLAAEGRSKPDAQGKRSLDPLERSLDHDYRVVMYLIRNASSHEDAREAYRFVLAVDFHLMRMCYRCLRRISRPMAESALLEMSSIVRHYAYQIGQQFITRRA